jgi:hypothetical protein
MFSGKRCGIGRSNIHPTGKPLLRGSRWGPILPHQPARFKAIPYWEPIVQHWPPDSVYYTYVNSYDSACNVLTSLTYDPLKKIETKNVCRYDTHGNLEYSYFFHDHGPEKISGNVRMKNQYDANGRLIEVAEFYCDTCPISSRQLYTYDGNGNMTDSKQIRFGYRYYNDSILVCHTECKYGREGLRTEVREMNYESLRSDYLITRFDSTGNASENFQCTKRGRVRQRYYYTYTYDPKDLVAEMRVYDKKKKLVFTERFTYEYYK